MDIKALDTALTQLIEKRMALSQMDYSDAKYDDLEEALHDLEDDFLEAYEAPLEAILQEVHDQYCPESDVLSPLAYVGQKYVLAKKTKGGKAEYLPETAQQGLLVEVRGGQAGRLLWLAGPPRLLLITQEGKKTDIVWQG
ncbi:hypothetical protein [Eisenibacter elegans]|uniref:hypothetical protein n=1 Tax=Eisenibacter elegans TaxID=997 RepID=UPI00041E6C98|nr:hypothetical protein [Eisenibacter elegans]